MLALQIDETIGEGVLVYGGGRLVNSGDDLRTAEIMSLLNDAPAQEGDVLPDGTPRRGWWADAFDPQNRVLGSRLWLLEGAPCTEETAQRAKTYASEALQHLIDDGRVKSYEFFTQVGDEAVLLAYRRTLKDGTTITTPFLKVA